MEAPGLLRFLFFSVELQGPQGRRGPRGQGHCCSQGRGGRGFRPFEPKTVEPRAGGRGRLRVFLRLFWVLNIVFFWPFLWFGRGLCPCFFFGFCLFGRFHKQIAGSSFLLAGFILVVGELRAFSARRCCSCRFARVCAFFPDKRQDGKACPVLPSTTPVLDKGEST